MAHRTDSSGVARTAVTSRVRVMGCGKDHCMTEKVLGAIRKPKTHEGISGDTAQAASTASHTSSIEEQELRW
jgi:hypothetical protein